jgi:hypothetical protein
MRTISFILLCLLAACAKQNPPPGVGLAGADDNSLSPSAKTLDEARAFAVSQMPGLNSDQFQHFVKTDPILIRPGLLPWQLRDGDLYTHYHEDAHGNWLLLDGAAVNLDGTEHKSSPPATQPGRP